MILLGNGNGIKRSNDSMVFAVFFYFLQYHLLLPLLKRIKTMFGSSLLSVVCREWGLMSYLRYLCLFA